MSPNKLLVLTFLFLSASCVPSGKSVSSSIGGGVTTIASTPIAVPSDVTNLAVSSNTSTSTLSFTWTSGGLGTVNYIVSYALGNPPINCSGGTLVTGTAIALTGLKPHTTYGVRVCAQNGNASPDLSSGITATGTTMYDAVAVNKKGCGIFVLDEGVIDATRALNTKYLSSANDGFVLRLEWSNIETAKDVYDFSIIQNIIQLVQAKGKKLSLLVQWGAYPSWFLTDPNYTGQRALVASKGSYTLEPWDPYLLQVYESFLSHLASATVIDNGVTTTLAKHSSLSVINIETAGIGRLRKDQTNLTGLSTYDRTKFVAAVMNDLKLVQKYFPDTQMQFPMWNITDNTSSPTLWSVLIDNIFSYFDGVHNPKLVLVQDNLAASKDLTTGIMTVYPSMTSSAAPLQYNFASKGGLTGFQALTCWSNPWSADQVIKTANTTPLDGINLAKQNYGSTYFEIYGVDYSNYLTELTTAHTQLSCPQ